MKWCASARPCCRSSLICDHCCPCQKCCPSEKHAKALWEWVLTGVVLSETAATFPTLDLFLFCFFWVPLNLLLMVANSHFKRKHIQFDQCGVSLLPAAVPPLPPLRMAAHLARNSCIPGAKATWARRGGGVSVLYLQMLAVTLCDKEKKRVVSRC